MVILALLVVVAVVVANNIIKTKIEHALQNDLPKTIRVEYDDLSVSFINGSIYFDQPFLQVHNLNDTLVASVKLDGVGLSGISFWDIIFKKKYSIEKLRIQKPEIVYQKHLKDTSRSKKDGKVFLGKQLSIKELILEEAAISVYNHDSVYAFGRNLNFELSHVKFDSLNRSQFMPFSYDRVQATGDSCFIKVNKYDNLKIGNFTIDQGDLTFNNVNYYTRYSKKELTKMLRKQRDHYELTVENLKIDNFALRENDSVLNASSSLLSLNTPHVEIYRNKMLPEDMEIKYLYSHSLRELPFQLQLDSLQINNAYLKYIENVHPETRPGYIDFSDLKVSGRNFSNIPGTDTEVNLNIHGLFMKETPIAVDWKFDVLDVKDAFVFKAKVGRLSGKSMEPLTKPNMKVQVKGIANKTYFTINGNNEASHIDLKINYEDVKIELLDKKAEDKKGFLSAILNIFVSKDSKKKGEQYCEETGGETRIKNKSVFNLIWISIKSALKKCLL